MAQRTTQRPSNYAFSQQLHLTNALAQRVLALALKEGLSPMQAVLKCLDDHLPRVRVQIEGEAGQIEPVVGATPSQVWELHNKASKIDLPTEADIRDFAPSISKANKNGASAADDAVLTMLRVAQNQPLNKHWTASDLFFPGTWLKFPSTFRTSVLRKFSRAMAKEIANCSMNPKYKMRAFRNHTIYTRLR
jgi:hypothetical protein